MNKQTIKDVNLKDKKIIMRADFNVPLDDNLNITDDLRIQAALPTIKYILEQSPAKLILMSHLGRPKGQAVDKMRLTPVARKLQQVLGEDVLATSDCVGSEVADQVANAKERVVLLENLRFHKEEEGNNPDFAKQLASLADIYVNDAFGTAHRAHASTEGITKYLPAVAGFLLEKEIAYLGKAIHNPERPFVVILGGAKVSDKILLIENLLTKADTIIISGGMAYTFLKAQGQEIGKSLLEEDRIPVARELLEKAKKAGVKIALTSDFLVVDDFDNQASKRYVDDIPAGTESLDVGPKTIEQFKAILSEAKTVVWNGPLGVFEIDAYAEGTKAIAEHLATLKDTTTIIGGGDSAAAVKKFNVEAGMTHISTGGGASLELLEGKELPGIAALQDK
ncbi:MAG: phosphoglycerate kinase [Candidatus Omnitrophica bacterium]|nr:phosphoglycerate kinase [Candidatus Omnitrophota bacterium]